MISLLSQKLRKITISQGYGVVAFLEASTEKCQLELWCRFFPNIYDREMLVRDIVSWLS